LVDFSELNAKDCLAVPIINVDGLTHEISCCFNKLRVLIDPIFPSLYSEPYKIIILSFSKSSLLLNLIKEKLDNNKEEYIFDSPEEYIKYSPEIKSNKPIEIQMNIPKMKDKYCLKETHFLKFNLEFKFKKYNEENEKNIKEKPFILPFIIKMELFKINLKFSSNNNKIKLDNDKFYIDEDLYSEEIISLSLEQVELKKEIKLKPLIQIEGLKDNNSHEPVIDINNEDEDKNHSEKTKINILIPKTNDNDTKMNIFINIYYSKDFKIPILINSNILPFDYKLLFYDYYCQELFK